MVNKILFGLAIFILVFMGVVSAENIVIENNNLRINFLHENNKIMLNNVENLNTGYKFEFIQQPMWWMVLNNVATKETKFVHSNSVICGGTSYDISGSSTKVLHLYWNNCELITGNFVDVTYTITLESGKDISKWRVNVDNNMADYGINQFRMVFDIKQDESQDTFAVFPAQSGHVVKNPADNVVDEFLTVSGVSIQLAPYYTKNGNGLYLASADGSATYNKLQQFTGKGNSYEYKFGFYVPDNIVAGNDYSSEYDYLVGVFQGDWYDAAKIYRKWAQGEKILEKGKLKSRSDIPQWYKNLDLITINFMSNFNNYQQKADDYASARDFYGAENSMIFLWNWVDNENNKGLGNYDASNNVPQFISALKNKGIKSGVYTLGFANSLIGNYGDDFDGSAGMDIDGNKVIFDGQNGQFIDPSQTAWQEHYKFIAKDKVAGVGASGLYFDNPYAIYFTCYDPTHGHTLGMGGNYLYKGYVDLLTKARNAGKQVDPNFVTLYEKESERYIRASDSIGISGLLNLPIGNSENTRSIPLFPTIYHDYAVQIGANNKPLYLSQGYTNYKDLHYGLAAGAIYGAVPFVSESAYEIGFPLNYKLEDLPDAGEYGKTLSNHARFVRDIIKTRKQYNDYLIFGKILRSPKTNSPEVAKEFCKGIDGGNPNFGCVAGKYKIYAPEVLSSAWKSTGGKIGLFFINYNEISKSVTFEIDVSEYDLSSSSTYGLYEIDDQGVYSLAGQFKGDSSISVNLEALSPNFYEILPLGSVNYCGDNICSGGEDCGVCSVDCGACPVDDAPEDDGSDDYSDESGGEFLLTPQGDGSDESETGVNTEQKPFDNELEELLEQVEVADKCVNGLKNFGEKGVDCGGDCPNECVDKKSYLGIILAVFGILGIIFCAFLIIKASQPRDEYV